MSARGPINKANNEEYTEEDSEGVSDRCYRLLKTDYEICRQEIHDIKRKFELNEAMLREVQETNELLEHTFEQRVSEKEQIISEVEEKYRLTTKEYENIISGLETKLAKQSTEIEKLRQCVNQQKETECVETVNQVANISLQADNASLKKRIDELTLMLRDEKQRSQSAVETIDELRARCNEFEYVVRNIKEQLNEKSTALEDARAELALSRTEAGSLNINPIADTSKGNSLFAEVEDRRRNVVDKMNTLRDKYTEVKRICKAQVAEIKTLRTERIAVLSKWENDTDHALAENNELIQKYKNRISDLERKLKSEIKKNDETKQLNFKDASFGYFQSLLDTKKKETDELRIKVEDLSTRLLVQEETKMNITKQLQYSRHKTSLLEAQVSVLEGELTLRFADNKNAKMHVKECEDFINQQNIDTVVTETELVSEPRPENTVSVSQSQAHCKVIDLPENERNLDLDTAAPETVTLKKLYEIQHISNTDERENKCSKKIVRFTENMKIEKSNESRKPTEPCVYPIVYVSTDANN